MTRNSRKTLLATTMLAGLAIFTLDAAQAGPNGPSFSAGSISGFSSMRMDFNRIGGPGRALSRNDLRVVPVAVVKTTEKPKETKSVAKKDTATKHANVARVSKPKPVSGGRGKQDAGSGPGLQINPTLVDVFTVFGGNTEAIFGLTEMLALIENGPVVVGNPLSPAKDGGTFVPPVLGDGGERWGEARDGEDTNAPGGPNTGKSGWAAGGGGWTEVTGLQSQSTSQRNGEVYHSSQRVYVFQDSHGNNSSSSAGDTTMTVDNTVGSDGSSKSTTTYTGSDGVTVIIIDSESAVVDVPVPEDRRGDNKKDSQPVEEGSGRGNSNDCGWWGCTSASSSGPSNPRIIPPETEGTAMGRSQSTSWATDPSEEGYTGGTGGSGERGGFDPRDERCENPDACGGPES